MKVKYLTLVLICIFLSTSTAIFPVYGRSGVRGMIKTAVSGEDTAMVNHFIRQGYVYLNKTSLDLDKVQMYVDSASMLLKNKRIDLPPSFHLLKAEFFFARSDYNNSEEEAKLSIEKAKNSKEYLIQAKAMIFLGNYYLRTGAFAQSIDNYEKCIALAKERRLKGIIPACYWGQSRVMNVVGDIKGLNEMYVLMADAALAEEDFTMAMDAWRNQSHIFVELERDFRKADSLLKKCYNMSLVTQDSSFTAFSSANIGWNFYREEMYDSSIYYYNTSLLYSIPGKKYSISANSYGNLGTINRDMGNFDKALSYYKKAIEQANMINDFYNLQWIYMDMSDMYIKSGDTANAYIKYVQYKKYSDEWIKSETAKGVTDARIRYEVDTHNKEVALLSLRLKNNRILNYGFLGLILLTVTIGLLIFRGLKLEDKRRMSEMNHKISELTQANLRQQMNPHFIFNTLNSIQYYMYQHDKLATNTYLTKFSSLMRKILENSSKTSVPLRDEIDALTLYLDLERLRFKDKFSYEINVDEEIDPLLYKVPTMLIQPYVENSICHGLMTKENNGLVRIDMKLQNSHIVCTIEDNGIGRKAAQERRRTKEANHNSMGTQIVSSRLELVNSLYGTNLHTVYTDLTNDAGEAVGTRVEIHIPVMT